MPSESHRNNCRKLSQTMKRGMGRLLFNCKQQRARWPAKTTSLQRHQQSLKTILPALRRLQEGVIILHIRFWLEAKAIQLRLALTQTVERMISQ